MEIEGSHNTAVAFTESLDNGAIGQIRSLCNQEFTEGAKLRIMPDAHAGKGCVIGTTMTIKDKIVPNLVGVDIGCGMETVNIGTEPVDFVRLDQVISERVPVGSATRLSPHRFVDEVPLKELTCARFIKMKKATHSLGTLGGGNHFIEIARDETSGEQFLIIHSGSRHVGLQVAKRHQKRAASRGLPAGVPFELAFLSGKYFDDYVHDMEIMRTYADLNRKAMAEEIINGMNWRNHGSFSTIHNYLDTGDMILRKGAVSARKGERLLIPFNMRDGSLICEGLGNPDWNYSAPHGAGRLYSRRDAQERISLADFQNEMDGIYSTCVSEKTLDESPMAYKPMEEIISAIGETVKIVAHLKPIYNFKAGE